MKRASFGFTGQQIGKLIFPPLLAILAFLGVIASSAPVSADDPVPFAAVTFIQRVVEVPNSSANSLIVGQQVARMMTNGMDAPRDTMRTYEVGGSSEDLIVAHPGLRVLEAFITVLRPGVVRPSTAVEFAPNLDRAQKTRTETAFNGRAPVPSFTAPYWAWFESPYCYSRYTSDWGYHDACFQTYKLYDDNDSTWDYFQFHHKMTAGPDDGYLKSAYLESDQSVTSATMNWVDWSPGTDTSGNCSPYSFGISIPYGGVSFSFNRCETWNMTKYSDAAHYRMDWGTGSSSDRELGYVTAVKISNGAYPVWYAMSGHTSCLNFVMSLCDSSSQW